MFLYICAFFIFMRRRERRTMLLGTIVCVVLLSLTPIISASENKSTQQNQSNQTEKIVIKKESGLFTRGVFPRHFILFILVSHQLEFRMERGLYLEDISSFWDRQLIITHPGFFLLGRWLQWTEEGEAHFWDAASHLFGWHWPNLSD